MKRSRLRSMSACRSGDLLLLDLPADTGLTLVTYSAEPGTPSEAGLRELAGWSIARDKLTAVEATSGRGQVDANAA